MYNILLWFLMAETWL